MQDELEPQLADLMLDNKQHFVMSARLAERVLGI